MNSEDRGIYLGAFNSEDKILIIFNDGTYEMTTFDFSNRFKMSDIQIIEKYDNSKVYTLLHFEGKVKKYYLKRFKIDIHSIGKRYLLISENRFFYKEPIRGDVVVFKTPTDNRTDYIKRLIGMPGDLIQFIDGDLFINIITKQNVVKKR